MDTQKLNKKTDLAAPKMDKKPKNVKKDDFYLDFLIGVIYI